ncbi:MAG: hypothetical protein JNG89_14190 [Planctomycetaceae bacterium]|nr:hypothetical protein [Planctomycetaceae bacterium]
MDPYELCPCGSKKKIKFCCHALYGEMEKVTRLQENNQPRMALQLLEKLDKTHPDNPWVTTRTAMLLLSEGRSEEAETILRTFLRKHQDHAFANVLYGIAAYGAAGYPEAKRAIHRAFRFGGGDFQEFIASLATDVGIACLSHGHCLSARQHLALALRWSDAEQRKAAFSMVYEFDGNQSVPYPFRGSQPMPAWSPPAPLSDALARALQLGSIGCWHEAAEHLTTVAAAAEQPAEFWHTVGLYRAWDGADDLAATALHKAAAGYADFETAVDCETLAQLLDRQSPDRRSRMLSHQYDVPSVARLLSLLDAVPRLSRAMLTQEEVEATRGALTARYVVLDRDRPAADSEVSLETVPRSIGAITVFTGNSETGPQGLALASGFEGALSEATVAVFQAAAGDAATTSADAEPIPNAAGVDNFNDVFESLYFDETARNADATRVLHAEWQKSVHEKWPQTPQPALGGRTPRDAAGVPELRAPLAAAINVLDAACARRGTILDVGTLREQLQLPEVAAIRADAGTNVSMLSFAQCLRVDPGSLNHQQVEQLAQRAMLMRHPGFAMRILKHAIEDAEFGAAERQMFILVLSQICDDSFQTDEALEWISRGHAGVEDGPQKFEQLARWRMRELTTRSNAEPGPELDALLRDLWQTYAPKLPGLREMLSQTVEALGIPAPWENAILTASDLSAATSESWSPVGAAAGGEKKLWLPGDR